MSAVRYAWTKGQRMEQVTETAGTDPRSTADTEAATLVTDNTAVDYTAVAAAIATLVSDGASPTQGHVNTLNTAWGTFKTALDTLKAQVAVVKTATAAAAPSATVDVMVLTGQKPLDVIVGVDLIRQRIGTSKKY